MEIVLRGKPAELAEMLPKLTVNEVVAEKALADTVAVLMQGAEKGLPDIDKPDDDMLVPPVKPHIVRQDQEEEVHQKLVALMNEREQGTNPEAEPA